VQSAWALGNPSLVSLSNGPKLANGNVLISIWSRAGAYNQTELAADIGPRILRFYEEYFNTSFPLPKQDMIAIPGKREIIQAIFCMVVSQAHMN
jgi:aminopeptidase N